MENNEILIRELLEKKDSLFKYIERKTGTLADKQKNEIVQTVLQMMSSSKTGLTPQKLVAQPYRLDGILYESIIKHLTGVSKSVSYSADFYKNNKTVEFKTAFNGAIPIKIAKNVHMVSGFYIYERFEKLWFITTREPPFTVYEISSEELKSLINRNNYFTKEVVGEFVNGDKKYFVHVPVEDAMKTASVFGTF